MVEVSKLDNLQRKIKADFAEENNLQAYAVETEELEEELFEEEQEVLDEGFEEAEEDELVEEDEELEEVKPVKKTQTSKPSKQEAKIVALKRENQRLAEENRRLAQESKESAARKDTFKKQYIAEGYDEDEAMKRAERDERDYQNEERLSMIEFRDDNYEILAQYPQSRKDIRKIMAAVKATGMTAEQVCRGLYGSEMGYTDRAESAARGTLPRRYADDPASRTFGAKQGQTKGQLTARDRQLKAELESMTGIKISNERFLEHKRKYNIQ